MPDVTLYYRSTCPYCLKVLNFLEENDMSIELRDISESSEIRQKLIDVGGKQQVPCLFVDGKALYESDDIINWLKENYQKS
jgi:glutaredoxin 3